jgi:putative transposase
VLRYVERNALRAGLVERAEDWRWGSLWRRRHGDVDLLHGWPVPEPADWCEQVNRPQTEAELEAVRRAVARGCPFGGAAWQAEAAVRLGLGSPSAGPAPRTARPRRRRRQLPLLSRVPLCAVKGVGLQRVQLPPGNCRSGR